jgi:isopentenyl-diphosphate delta-isomerase
VGHGISAEVALTLFDAGVHAIDVAGVGGTSYAWVEAERSQNDDFAKWFKSFGIPTDQSVIEASNARTNKQQLVIASGGVRSPIDGLKSHALGADLFSAAVPFLEPAMTSVESIVAVIENWKQGLRIAMFAAGVRDWNEAKILNMSC